jgi:hypothetical protein
MTPRTESRVFAAASRVAMFLAIAGLAAAYASGLAGVFGLISSLRVAFLIFSAGTLALFGTAVYFAVGSSRSRLTFYDRHNTSAGRHN